MWCSGTLPCREAGSRATVHEAAVEPLISGRWDLGPLETWQPRSAPWLGGRVRCRRARGSTWVHALLLVFA
jgi:hypothetical protein